MNSAVISVNKNIQGGTPCYVGTRVPVDSLFDHLLGGYTIDYFLEEFPSVKREQVMTLLQEMKPSFGQTDSDFRPGELDALIANAGQSLARQGHCDRESSRTF